MFYGNILVDSRCKAVNWRIESLIFVKYAFMSFNSVYYSDQVGDNARELWNCINKSSIYFKLTE